MRRTGTGHDRSAIYDTSMCLAVLTPSLARVRHWSCPDRLPSDTLEEHFDQHLLAVDDSLSTYKHSATQRCLAQWEEKILRLREARSKRKRNSVSSSNESEQHPFFPLGSNHNTAGLDIAQHDVFVHSELAAQHDVFVHSQPRLLALVEPYQNTGGGGSNQSIRLSECPNLSENPSNNRIAHIETKPDNSFNLCDGTRTLSDNQTCLDPSRALDPTQNLKWQKSACAVNTGAVNLRPDDVNCASAVSLGGRDRGCIVNNQKIQSQESSSLLNYPMSLCPPCPSNGYWKVAHCPSNVVSCLRDGVGEVAPRPSDGDCEVNDCSSDGDCEVALNPSDGNCELAPCPNNGQFKLAPRLSGRDRKFDTRPSDGDYQVALCPSIGDCEIAPRLSHEDSKVASFPSDGDGQVFPCTCDGDYEVVPWPSNGNSETAPCPSDGGTSDGDIVIAPGTSDGDCEIAPCLRDRDCEIAPCLRDGDCEIAQLPCCSVGAISSCYSCLLGDANSDGISEASQVDSCPNCSCCVDNGLFPVKSFPSLRVWDVSVQKLWLRLLTLCSYIITCSWVLSRYPNSLKQVKHLKGRPVAKLNYGSTGALYGFCLLFPLLLLVPIQANDGAQDPVCVGNINIKDNLKDFLAWKHCKVLEGSLMINMFNMDFIKHNQSQMQNVSLPELTEITDFLLLYRADQIIDLAKILPKLAVIRGNKLTNNYALVIYRMKYMQTISLPSLTHIVKGGVKIEKNPNLCYVDTIDWKKIVDKDWHDDISIEENSEEERCPKTCPLNCPSSSPNEGEKCWNADTCQKLIVKCPDGTDLPGQRLCYSVGGSEITRPCDKQCLGGCTGTTREDCISCKNMKFPNPNNNSESFGCREKCPDLLLSYMNWTCITEDACMSKSTCSGSLMENKVVPYKILRNSMGDQCVEECPGNYEAKEFKRDGRIINECVECKDCPKICIGENIKSHESAKSFSGCTIIDGDLEIKVSKSNIMSVLEENLGKIKVIKGSLRITRSKSLVSLHFFKSLEEIQGMGHYDKEPFAIEILENENLQKLFEENKNISISGKAFIHYNPQLCRKEITKLVSASGIDTGYDSEHLDISDTTNGDKAVCSELELAIRAEAMGTMMGVTILLIHFENFEKHLAEKNDADVRSLLGYNIYYREITEEQYAHKNLTKYEGREACGGEIWEIINQRKSDSKIIADNNNGSDHNIEKCAEGDDECFKDVLDRIVYPDETSFISQLKPYTPYAIYVSTLMTKPFSGLDATGAQSKIIYVRTLVGIPEPVRKLLVTATATSSGLEVSWEPPRKPNGILDHYDIIVEFNPLQEAFIDVDWCGEKKRKSKNNPVIQKTNPKANNQSAVCPKSDCPVCKNGDVNPKPVEEEDHIDDAYVEDEIINTIFSNKHHEGECNSKRIKRSAKQDDEAIENIIGISASKDEVDNADDMIEVNLGNEVKIMLAKNETEKAGDGVDDFYFTKLYTQVGGNETHLKVTIDHMKHYGQYSIKVRACHAVEKMSARDCKHHDCKRCSFEEEVVRKTMAKPKADDIVNPWSESRGEAQLLIAVGSKVPNGDKDKEEEDKADTSTGGETYIRWLPPQAPNEMITMYKLRMKKDLADESDEHVNCISFNDPKITKWEERPDWVQYKLTWAGSYYISLKAVSLYGEGAWTSYQWAQVQTDSDYVIYIVLVVILLALLMSFGLGVGMVYKKRRSEAEGPLIVSVNPEYIPTSEVYVVDEWEVPREVIDTQEELGKGSFGMVYRGLYHHATQGDLSVAIKTVNDQATLRQRIEFLNEASVMKDFDTEHVVKLIGVVSQGQPTLVLMELMDIGDLKNYLRTLRPNSDENIQREREGKEKIPPPTVKQIEKMALDIADGMAYLSVKKCIHRDLAARNCMVNNDITVKVGDFGMARDVYETEYYRKEGKGLLPVRWMAPESLRDGVFTSQSDVWSYGVVLWEMSTLAEQPYQGLANDQVVFYVKEGNVMEKPENCPEKLHGLMSDCWQRSASQRPTFLEICDRLLEGQDQSWGQSFVNNSFYHSSAGREAVANETNLKAARREADELASNNPCTPLTTTLNHVNKSDNGHLPGEEHPLVPISHTWKAEQFVRTNIENEKGDSRISSRSPGSNGPSQLASGEGSNGPGHLASNESSRSSKLSMNAVNGLVQRLRNKSGSASGEA